MIIGVLGANGEGKTSWILKFLKERGIVKSAYRVDIADKPFGADKDDWFGGLCNDILYNERYRGKWIIFDDVDNFDPRMGSLFDDLVIRARHVPVNIIYAARRPRGFTRNLVINTDYFVIFHISNEDRKFLEMFLGDPLPDPPPRRSHKPIILKV